MATQGYYPPPLPGTFGKPQIGRGLTGGERRAGQPVAQTPATLPGQTPSAFGQYGMASGADPRRTATNPYTTTPSSRFDPSPTAQSVLAMGGSMTRGFDPETGKVETTYQQAAPGYQQKMALDRLMGAMESRQGGTAQAQTFGRESFPSVSIKPIDATDAQNAAFAATKARAGALGRSAIDSLRAELADRGIMGGGTEARGLTDRLAAAVDPMSQYNVEALQQNVGLAQHAQDLSQQQAAQMFQGGIAQRGQDIGAAQSQADRDAAAKARQQQMILSAISSLKY